MNTWEIYSQILSLEGINLVYDQTATTAAFDVKSRTIFVPTFDYMTPEMMQRFVSHEVAHAKYTNYSIDDFRKYVRMYGDLFNVVEDAYIESRIVKEFPGLKEIFRTSTKHFIEHNLFNIVPEEIPTYSLVERLNIYTKCDDNYVVPFEGIENQFAYRIKMLNSNDDVINLCHDISGYLLSQKEKNNHKNKNDESDNDSSEYDESFQYEKSEDEAVQNKTIDISISAETEEDIEVEESEESFDDHNEENESEEIFDDSEEENESVDESEEEEPEDKYDSIKEDLTDNIGKQFEENVSEYGKNMIYDCKNSSIDDVIDTKESYRYIADIRNLINAAEESYDNFATNNFKKVTYKMIRSLAATADKIFQQKKSANELRNSNNRTTGKIDMKKIAKYRTNDNIFRTIRSLPKGKNHGVMILIDFSGSMGHIIKDTIIQAAILAEFCMRNGIKFEIFLFGCHVSYENESSYNTEKKCAIIMDDKTYNLKALLAYGLKFSGTRSTHFTMGSTPTNIALSYVIEELPRWKTEVEKVSVFVITDGGYNKREEKIYNAVINGIKFSIDDDIHVGKRDLIHTNWLIEFLCKYIKQIHGAYVSISHIGYDKRTLLGDIHPNVRDALFNCRTSYFDDYYRTIFSNGIDGHVYIFKHNYYFREMTFDASQKSRYMSCNFKKNPFIDQCQIIFKEIPTYENNNDSNLLTDTFNNYNMYSLFVNNFISEIA